MKWAVEVLFYTIPPNGSFTLEQQIKVYDAGKNLKCSLFKFSLQIILKEQKFKHHWLGY